MCCAKRAYLMWVCTVYCVCVSVSLWVCTGVRTSVYPLLVRWCAYLNVFPYVINLFDPSKETSSTEWWFELAAPLIIGFFVYGGSYFIRVDFLLRWAIHMVRCWCFGTQIHTYEAPCHEWKRCEESENKLRKIYESQQQKKANSRQNFFNYKIISISMLINFFCIYSICDRKKSVQPHANLMPCKLTVDACGVVGVYQVWSYTSTIASKALCHKTNKQINKYMQYFSSIQTTVHYGDKQETITNKLDTKLFWIQNGVQFGVHFGYTMNFPHSVNSSILVTTADEMRRRWAAGAHQWPGTFNIVI